MNPSCCSITLSRLKESEIEMVRNWRNDQKIARHMFYQEEITPDMQKRWYHSLHPTSDYYFVINLNSKQIGLNHVSQIDESSGVGQVGLFVYEESFWGTPIPVMASLALLEFCFEELSLESVIAKVRIENEKAIEYNLSLGFKPISNTQYELTKENYKKTTTKLREKMKTWYNKAVK